MEFFPRFLVDGDAACHAPDVDPDWFFHPDGPGGWDGLDRARRLCASCPLRSGCEAYATDTGQRWGVWAGLTARQIRRRRRRLPGPGAR